MLRTIPVLALVTVPACALVDGLQGQPPDAGVEPCVPGGRCYRTAQPYASRVGAAYHLAPADLDDDGAIDLVVGGVGTALFFNRGDGLLNDEYLEAGWVASLAVGRFDDDDHDDFAMLRDDDGLGDAVTLYLGGPSVTDVVSSRREIPVTDVYRIGALDADGVLGADLVVASTEADDTLLLANDGALGFTSAVIATQARTLERILAGNFGGDASADFAYLGDDAVGVLVGDGAGGFTETVIAERTVSQGVAFDDRWRGFHDVLLVSGCDPCDDDPIVDVYQGDGLRIGGVDHTGPFLPSAVAVGSFDDDEHQDLVIANDIEQAELLIATGWDGERFASVITIVLGAPIAAVAAADLDGDGHDDLVVAHNVGGVLSVMLAE